MKSWPVAGVVILSFALLSRTALAQGMGMGRGGMWGGGCRMTDVTRQPLDPASLPEPQSLGAGLLKSKCTQCHGLISPREHAAQEWPNIVDRMDRRTQMMARGQMGMMGASYLKPLTAAEKTALVGYLERNSFRAVAPGTVPEKGDPAAQAFFQTCSACHAPPDPAAHPPAEWEAVVTRMGRNMEQQGFGPLPPEQKALVLSYLRKSHE